ncbi:hypothetical protein TcWFU_009024 [Taenia crassiceps]|uniref:Uncharacterized protein n=1 Tax=Taenia crassiceps TaxID=6207 RepID=A0ABR4QM57_9CEST
MHWFGLDLAIVRLSTQATTCARKKGKPQPAFTFHHYGVYYSDVTITCAISCLLRALEKSHLALILPTRQEEGVFACFHSGFSILTPLNHVICVR